jgi:hypothetical protein
VQSSIRMAIVGVLSAALFWAVAKAQSADPAADVPPSPAADAITGQNLVRNEYFSQLAADGKSPADYQITGDVEYRYLGNPTREVSGYGVALQSGKDLNKDLSIAGSVSQTVSGIDAKAGRWFRFSFRGLPQDNFAVTNDDLYMKVEFFGNNGKTSYDAKAKPLYSLIQQARKDLAVNGDFKKGGAAAWRNYVVDFYLPFPQVDQLRLSVGFGHGAAKGTVASEFCITRFSLVRIAPPPIDPATASSNAPVITSTHFVIPQGQLLPLGGRWYYDAKPDETQAPQTFDYTNVDRLLYKEGGYSAPFAGATSAWLRAGDKDIAGNVVQQDRLIKDNVTISFDATAMIIHTHGIPNHATGKFPQQGFGNPNYINEREATYYIPLDPKVNPKHVVTTATNSNHALPMGPIGIAINGVVFFNPFDADSQDASNIMDFCCGHPNQNGQYHYHKYPICINSPWADEGSEHSPLLGFAFDGFPIYGPYESANVMAKDVRGEHSLNEFSMHFDQDRGWHYHVTPGKFPYIIGGYWGTEDSRDMRRRGPPGGGLGGGGAGGFQGRGGPPN